MDDRIELYASIFACLREADLKLSKCAQLLSSKASPLLEEKARELNMDIIGVRYLVGRIQQLVATCCVEEFGNNDVVADMRTQPMRYNRLMYEVTQLLKKEDLGEQDQ